MARRYWVYILTNRYRTVFYTGVTNNLERRLGEHRGGKEGGFSARYRVKYLIYFEKYNRITVAIDREKQLKRWTREKKLHLVHRVNPDLIDLTDPMPEQ